MGGARYFRSVIFGGMVLSSWAISYPTLLTQISLKGALFSDIVFSEDSQWMAVLTFEHPWAPGALKLNVYRLSPGVTDPLYSWSILNVSRHPWNHFGRPKARMAFSLDGSQILLGSTDSGGIEVFDVATGIVLQRLHQPSMTHSLKVFSPIWANKVFVFTTGKDATRIYDLYSGKEIRTFPYPPRSQPLPSFVSSGDWRGNVSQNGTLASDIRLDGRIRLLDLMRGRESTWGGLPFREEKVFRQTPPFFIDVAFDGDGELIEIKFLGHGRFNSQPSLTRMDIPSRSVSATSSPSNSFHRFLPNEIFSRDGKRMVLGKDGSSSAVVGKLPMAPCAEVLLNAPGAHQIFSFLYAPGHYSYSTISPDGTHAASYVVPQGKLGIWVLP